MAFAAVIVVFSLARPESFPTWANAQSILKSAAPALVIAATLTVVLVMQDFDLSFGATIGLAAGAAVILMANQSWPWELALAVALLFGLVAGIINGVLIAYLGGSSFIMTLAMGTVLTGIEFAITAQKTIFGGLPEAYTAIGQGSLGGINTTVWIAGAIALVLWVVLDHTETGRYMYAIGGNADAARLAGIRTRFLRLIGFAVVGVGAAVVGVLLSSQSASYSPAPGAAFLLPAYAAAFLGSAVFRPGEFNIPGTVVGVLLLGTIQTGLTMLDLETYAINLVQGGILIIAVLASRVGQREA
jgi:ribose transport system permease protein